MNTNSKILNAGVHLVTIKSIKYAFDLKKELRSTKNGNCGLDIAFVDSNKNSISQIFWLTDKSRWIFEKLFKAIALDFSLIENLIVESNIEKVREKISKLVEARSIKAQQAYKEGKYIGYDDDKTYLYKVVNEAVGKTLFILVAEHYRLLNGLRKKDYEGKDKFENVVLPNFFPVIDINLPPEIKGNPAQNNGVCSGVFLIETNFNTGESFTRNNNYEDNGDNNITNPLDGDSYSKDWVRDVFGINPDSDFIPWSNID